ncbi:mycothione reductase [Corynebacterium ammoniagenes]|uniref:Mycothione reductase n=1 Tax=Corynebacterium ammoniagenes DSM 20306 TaxID=649754 RepID=A0ABN0AI87_CORAM|nr:mycothione reductase [Corynebacterium ammoniagenes]APT82425.1 mycothione reductase [Corynebacterium ammoniagenes DSM 20306]AQS73508.1 mycothione reductase [Corynebacterium ammoniagenes]EFG82635.1 mycothione reductase [Corynebacterium ammoniagenes DSM 20306]
MTHYDLIIIGAGSGNSIPTPEHDDISIAIIEKDKFGGTCMNVGCIPTKMYVYAADVAHQTEHSQKLGITGEVTNVDWDSIVDRVFTNRIDKIAEGGEAYRRGDETPNITVYDQRAEFIGPKTIKTGDDVITGDQIIIATGSRPQIPEAIAESGATYHTNETIMRLPEQPKSLVIVGGGFIAMEFAHVFAGLGTDVTIVNRSETLLRWLDTDLSSRFNKQARERFNVITHVNVNDLENTSTGVKVSLDNGAALDADAILVATGRIPNGDQMNLDAAGIDMHNDGRIKVDDYGRTTAEGIWALGDVSSPYMLKHVANAETKAVRHNMLNPDDMVPMPHDHVPSAIFTHPQIATVGLTEEQARGMDLDITVKVQNYGDVAYGWAMEDNDGICKLIADKNTGKLLGAHYYGPQASTLIQQMITVMAFDMDVRDFAQKQYWIHPALPEVTENALLGLEFN